MTTLDESKQKFLNDYICNGTYYDSLEFATGCEIVYDRERKEKKKQKWKFSKRTIAISKYKFLIFKKNFFGKGISLEKELYLLDIIEIIEEGNKETVSFKFQCDTVVTIRDVRAMGCVKKIRESIMKITFGVPKELQVKVNIPTEYLESLDNIEVSPAHGFSESYHAQCNYRKTKPQPEIVLYVEDLHMDENREFDLRHCPGITENKSDIATDLIAVGAALSHNTYFKSVVMSDITHKEALQFAATILKSNQTITKLVIRNSGSDCTNELGENLSSNRYHQIQIIDFSGNTWGASAMLPLAFSIRSFTHKLSVLSLANCNISPKSINALIHALKSNWGVSLGLEEFDLSHNKFDESSVQIFREWFNLMKSHSKIRRLGLSGCNIDVLTVLKSIQYCPNLQFLDISHNDMSRVSSTQMEQTLPTSNVLSILNLSYTHIPIETLTVLLRTLFLNEKLDKLCLNLSNNSMGPKNANILADVLGLSKNLDTLNIASNALGKGCTSIISSLQDNISSLVLDDNLVSLSNNDHLDLFEALANLIRTRPNIKRLSINGNKTRPRFKESILVFFEALKDNQSLIELDISDNSMKDSLYSQMCLALRGNSHLRTLICDGNSVTISGHQSLLRTMTKNKTLTRWSFPSKDLEKYGNEKRHIKTCEDITRRIVSNGEAVNFEDVFSFFTEWDQPESPAPPLEDVPNYLVAEKTQNDSNPMDFLEMPQDLPPEIPMPTEDLPEIPTEKSTDMVPTMSEHSSPDMPEDSPPDIPEIPKESPPQTPIVESTEFEDANSHDGSDEPINTGPDDSLSTAPNIPISLHSENLAISEEQEHDVDNKPDSESPKEKKAEEPGGEKQLRKSKKTNKKDEGKPKKKKRSKDRSKKEEV